MEDVQRGVEKIVSNSVVNNHEMQELPQKIDLLPLPDRTRAGQQTSTSTYWIIASSFSFSKDPLLGG
jgi:hypothetical protein